MFGQYVSDSLQPEARLTIFEVYHDLLARNSQEPTSDRTITSTYGVMPAAAHVGMCWLSIPGITFP